MIKSQKGKELISYISPIYENSKVMQAIFEAIGSEWDSANEISDDILNQLFPQSATWGLSIWEQRLDLITNLTEDLERRRGKVIAKLQTKYPITPKNMAMIIKSYTGADIEVIENVAPYIFEIKLTSREGFPKDLEDLYITVKKIKPSHLGVRYKLTAITQSELYIGLTSFTGESITTYPWTPTKIESKTNVYIPIAQHSGLENITTYPKED